ncbi:MAG: sugar phosphate nucleotidyltransferase [Terriglobia bacterium]
MQAVVLVGGEGKRLRPLTLTKPKPFLSLANGPFLDHTLRMLKRHGVTEVILATGYLPSAIEDYFAGGRYGLKVHCVSEDTPLDTCGAVVNVADMIDDTFLVFNGDILTGMNLTHLVAEHKLKQAKATISLTWVEDPTAYGLVSFDESGWVTGFLEKPTLEQVTSHWINAGVYVLERDALDLAPRGVRYSFERGLFPRLLKEDLGVLSFCSSDYWADIGSPENYLLAHHNILYGKVPFDFAGTEISPGVWAGRGTKVDPEATLSGPTIIGEDCLVGKGAKISSLCSIGDECTIGENAVVEESVILSGSTIGSLSIIKESILGECVEIGRRVQVTQGAVVGDGTLIGDENHFAKNVRIWPNAEIGDNSIRF